MQIIGLTGGIACGKSYITNLLSSHGITIIDCDKIAHEAVHKGRWGHRRVIKAFGTGVLTSAGEVDREALGRIIFADPSARRKLNAATHMPVALELLRQLVLCWLLCRFVVVADMPLLFETGMHQWVHKSVVVWCEAEQQVNRLMTRDKLSRADALSRVSAQMSQERKKEMADMTVNNTQDRSALEHQVDAVVHQLRRGSWAWGLLTSPLVAGIVILGSLYWSVGQPD